MATETQAPEVSADIQKAAEAVEQVAKDAGINMEDVQKAAAAAAAAQKNAAPTRGERKSRKAMQKLGMKPVSGVVRVTVKRSKNVWPFKK